MILQDLHVHTDFCDGRDSPEEMVRAAVAMGIDRIGLCVHSYTSFDESYCVKKERVEEFIRTVKELRIKYSGKIEVLCGVEQDFYSTASTDGFDYVIGSVHYLKNGNVYSPIDESQDILRSIVRNYYGGDFLTMCRSYYDCVSQLPSRRVDIIGHIDLVTKFNCGDALFDEDSPEYMSIARKAVDSLIPYGRPFEINTGAISRGYRDVPYPAPSLLTYILKKGGRVILSSDAHNSDNLCYGFERWKQALEN